MALRIVVDRDACTGSRTCVERAPGTFSLDAERKAVVAEVPADADEAIRKAAAECPAFAIELEEVPA